MIRITSYNHSLSVVNLWVTLTYVSWQVWSVHLVDCSGVYQLTVVVVPMLKESCLWNRYLECVRLFVARCELCNSKVSEPLVFTCREQLLQTGHNPTTWHHTREHLTEYLRTVNVIYCRTRLPWQNARVHGRQRAQPIILFNRLRCNYLCSVIYCGLFICVPFDKTHTHTHSRW